VCSRDSSDRVWAAEAMTVLERPQGDRSRTGMSNKAGLYEADKRYIYRYLD